MAIEIATDKTITVKRPNADYLLKIRKGEVNLDEIIEQAEKDIEGLDLLFEKSGLPNECDFNFINHLLIQIRHFDNFREDKGEQGGEWVPIDKDKNNKMPAGVDFLVLYDNGEVRRFLEDDQPFAIATHWCKLPDLPNT